ncbi:splicing factor 3B subunit 2-like [Convolutriloba macropyga]|uniref:splicing factor 3B subunit 2-like n=1 Tax=Convolutriloba macropyga TaxID=536237 RepID=UPI003F528A2F
MTAETTLTQSNGQSTPVTNGVVIQNESSSLPVPNGVINEDEQEGAESDSSEATSQDPKVSRGKAKKLKKKEAKKRRKQEAVEHRLVNAATSAAAANKGRTLAPRFEVEYQPERIQLSFADPNYAHFMKIFEKYKLQAPPKKEDNKEDVNEKLNVESEVLSAVSQITSALETQKMPKLEDDDGVKDEETGQPTLSKKKLRKLNRLTVAELKQLVTRPDVVEMHDVTARDPKLLICLKSAKHTVPVPRHWNAKRKYLAGKRGFQKAPFDLPEFIKRTGIMEMRSALQEKEDAQSMKTKMRAKVRPKMGKIDIDYQKLHDAFFKYQTKPKLSGHGDLYYEGKEQETRMKEKKPGDISDDLRSALGMPVIEGKSKFPPPWLIAMQRYGPPPSYPNLRIPGLNAPIPEGCSFGYHAGGWGKPPVDSQGRPLYGDVFGQDSQTAFGSDMDADIDKRHWGEMESESEEEEDDESEEEQEAPDASGLITPGTEGLVTPSGLTSLPAGLETPEGIELRKKRMDDEAGSETPQLYTVLQEKKAAGVAASFMGSAHVYDMQRKSGSSSTTGGTSSSMLDDGTVEMALDPSELDMVEVGAGGSGGTRSGTDAALQARYEGALREQRGGSKSGEDFSDLVAEHAAKQRAKRKVQQDKSASSSSSKKHKEFKF